MYNYMGDSNAEDGELEFVVSPPSDKYDEDLSDVEAVEKSNPKIQRGRVGKSRGRGSATPDSSDKNTSVRSANKHHIQISTTPEISTKRTSISSSNKQKSQISFISTRKERTKHTV